MSKKYKLIKEYPGSPKLGTIITETNGWRITWEKAHNYPEFWEEVVEKDYKILSFKQDGLCKDLWTEFSCGWCRNSNGNPVTAPYSYNEILNNGGIKYHIHSVKRLSDGEIFTIGDKFKALTGSKEIEEIQSFEILHGVVRARMYHTQTKGSAIRLILEDPYIERYKTPLFTTEDGVDIYEGDYVCWMGNIKYGDGKISDYRRADKDMITDGHILYFSTSEAAEEYFLMNKPCLSVADIYNHFNGQWSKCSSIVHLKELVKSKL